jgi:hypothetical protein
MASKNQVGVRRSPDPRRGPVAVAVVAPVDALASVVVDPSVTTLASIVVDPSVIASTV